MIADVAISMIVLLGTIIAGVRRAGRSVVNHGEGCFALKTDCGKGIKTYEGVIMLCKRPLGHKGDCNPFSNNPPQGELNGNQSDS